MSLTITAYSTALFSTWFFIDELSLLFDAGDGVTSGLLQKGGKVKQIFISHADRDHLTGLLQFNQLNARKGFPIIHYPKDSGSFPALANFSGKFDPHVKRAIWNPIKEGDLLEIKNDLMVEAIRNNHIPAASNISKSLSFKVFKIKRKLKKEFLRLSGNEIKRLGELHGRAHITEEIKTNIITYSGDTPVDDYSRFDHSEILIHESTFLGGAADRELETHGNKHSSLGEVMEMAANINIGTLILSHFSSRYSATQIDRSIRESCKKFGIKIPVYRILPGEIERDVLKGEAMNG